MKAKQPSLSDFVDGLQAMGRYAFSGREARAKTQLGDAAFQKAARRLVLAKRLCSPREGFFVIVPLEYATAGAPPPTWFIDDLMGYVGQSYYVGLLSAASIHGAAHQQPQEFQVVTDAPLPVMFAGRARLRFVVKRRLKRTAVADTKTDTGTMRVSTPETTALDLVRYPKTAGGLNNVATVLAELHEKIDGARLAAAAKILAERSTAQRLGYLLDLVGGERITAELHALVEKQRTQSVPLRSTRVLRGLPKNEKWKVLVNAEVVPDEGIE